MCEMDSSSLCDVAFAMASGSSRGKGNTSLKHTHKRCGNRCKIDGDSMEVEGMLLYKKDKVLPAATVERNESRNIWKTDG